MGNTAHSDEIRHRLWNELVTARMCEFYWAHQAAKKRLWGRAFAYATAFFSSATIVAAIEETLELLGWMNLNPLWPALPAAIAGVIVGTERFEKTAMDFGNHSIAWNDLYHKLYNAWIDFETHRTTADEVLDVLTHHHEKEQNLDRYVSTERTDTKLSNLYFDKAEELLKAP